MPNGPYKNSPGDQNRTSDDKEIHSQTATTATSAGPVTIPALARGYIVVSVNGVDKKIPYYDV